jgi:hypothetical protein
MKLLGELQIVLKHDGIDYLIIGSVRSIELLEPLDRPL